MKKACFILALMMVFVLGFATVAAACMPPQAQAPQNSRNHQSCTSDTSYTEVGTLGIAMPPVEA